MQDEPVMRMAQLFYGDERHHVVLYRARRGAEREPKAMCYAENVCVYGECGFVERDRENDACRFTADAGQRF